ncbi:MAG: response regulator [Saprospiraceae bacterium]|nr:response regulator [Saprospiraceae bacterium]
MSTTKDNPILLVADDDADDRFLLRSAFEESGIKGRILFVEDGLDLLDFLAKTGRHSGQHQLPGVILLDLNMPKKDGKAVLAEMKANPAFQPIPVVVFSTSKSPDEIRELYRLGANSFIVKPSSFEQLLEVMRRIGMYWMDTVILP